MISIPRPISFVLSATNHGSMIVNRHDYHMISENQGYGVGHQLLSTSSFDQSEVDFALALLNQRKMHFGEGVVAIDCGANIGVHTIEWARLMHTWGEVISFEAQEKIYYALAGNIALNNCLNVTAKNYAVGAVCGSINISEPDYSIPSSFGSFELKQHSKSEFIGQKINQTKVKPVQLVSIDSLNLNRVDLIKIDVEGMEEDVLDGAKNTIKRCKPIMTVEIIKSNKKKIDRFLSDNGYICYPMGINILAIHGDDPVNKKLEFHNNNLHLHQ